MVATPETRVVEAVINLRVVEAVIILRGQTSSFIAIISPTSLDLIVPNYSVFLLFRY